MAKRLATTSAFIDHGAKVWLTRFSKHNLWRVRRWYELEDLIQDGFLIFCSVLAKYRHNAQNQAHLMRLFQTAFVNHVTNLANQRTADAAETLAYDLVSPEVADPNWVWDVMAKAHSHDHTVNAVLGFAPVPIKALCVQLNQIDGAVLRSALRRRRRGRETTNERLCRLAKVCPNAHDLPTMIRDYLSVK